MSDQMEIAPWLACGLDRIGWMEIFGGVERGAEHFTLLIICVSKIHKTMISLEELESKNA